jgi:hypothetical protein
MPRIQNPDLLDEGFVRLARGDIPEGLRSRDWTGDWFDRSGRGARWRQGERAEHAEVPVFAGQKGCSVIHFGPWTPTFSPAKTPV